MFLQELRAQPAGKNLVLSAATSITPFAGSDGTPMADVSQFASVLSHIAIMNYDINVSTSIHLKPAGKDLTLFPLIV
jgi:chitinase